MRSTWLAPEVYVIATLLFAWGCENASEDVSQDGGSIAPPLGCAEKLASGTYEHTLTHAGLTYTYRMQVPEGHDGSPVPTVINIHGYDVTPGGHEIISRLARVAGPRGYLYVLPGAPTKAWNGGTWCCGDAAEDMNDHDDVGFFRALVAELESKACIDRDRVYVTGLSNGGTMAHRLGCEAADLFAAIVPIAGSPTFTTCEPTRPISVMHFHGTADEPVPYEGDERRPSAPSTVEAWAMRNGCSGEPMVTYENGHATCVTRGACEGGVEVTLCTIQGLGHCWPGSTVACDGFSADIDANEELLDFFDRFDRSGPR